MLPEQFKKHKLGFDLPKSNNTSSLRMVKKVKSIDPKKFHERDFLQFVLQLVDDAVVITDAAGDVLFLNETAEKLFGWESLKAQHQPVSLIFQTFCATTLKKIENPVYQVLYENCSINSVSPSIIFTQNNGKVKIEYSATPIHNSHGQTVGVVLVYRDVEKSQRLFHELSWQLSHDSLTGLNNQFSFEQYLERAISSAKAFNQQHILCYLDLDRFNIINKAFGRVAGDEFLRQFSELLQRRVRKTDVLARLGGDEFGLLLYQCNLDQALGVLKTLREDIQKFRFTWEENILSVTASMGVVILDQECDVPSSMLSAADSACTEAKNRGRDRIQVYQCNDQDLAVQQGETLSALKVLRALEQDQFLLYCQPIVSVTSASETGTTNLDEYCEILLRLRDETGQILSPGDFIPAAERYGLMHLVDRWVVRSLLVYLSHLQKMAEVSDNPIPRQRIYSINLSGSSINDDQFLDFVKEHLAISAVPPTTICFEITETVAISNLDKAVQFMNQLKTCGCRFALDDFGSGMSSFGYLKKLPIDYLKIDGNFIRDLKHSKVAREIVESINRIGHVIGIETVAEFVESRSMLSELEKIGIDYAQGYGISQPFPLV